MLRFLVLLFSMASLLRCEVATYITPSIPRPSTLHPNESWTPHIHAGESITLTSANNNSAWCMPTNSVGTLTVGGQTAPNCTQGTLTGKVAVYTAPSGGFVANRVSAGCPVVASNSVYTTDISNAPVDAKSDQILGYFYGVPFPGNLAPLSSQTVDIAGGAPNIINTQTAQKLNMQFNYTGPGSWIDWSGIWPVAVPPDRHREGGALTFSNYEGEDHHLFQVDENCRWYEVYQEEMLQSNGNNNASGVQYDGYGTFDDPTGETVDAAGLPWQPLVPTADEIRTNTIRHAIRFTWSNPFIQADRWYHSVWPSIVNEVSVPMEGGNITLNPTYAQSPSYTTATGVTVNLTGAGTHWVQGQSSLHLEDPATGSVPGMMQLQSFTVNSPTTATAVFQFNSSQYNQGPWSFIVTTGTTVDVAPGAFTLPKMVPIYGQRFRLKPSFDVSHYSPYAQNILNALKKYGTILADASFSSIVWFIFDADAAVDYDVSSAVSEVYHINFSSANWDLIDESGLTIDSNGTNGHYHQAFGTAAVKPDNPYGVVPVNSGVIKVDGKYYPIDLIPVTLGMAKHMVGVQAGIGPFQFPIQVHGTSNTGYTLQIISCTAGAGQCGSVSGSTYTPPATLASSATLATVTLKAVANADATNPFSIYARILPNDSDINIDTGSGTLTHVKCNAAPAVPHQTCDQDGCKWWQTDDNIMDSEGYGATCDTYPPSDYHANAFYVTGPQRGEPIAHMSDYNTATDPAIPFITSVSGVNDTVYGPLYVSNGHYIVRSYMSMHSSQADGSSQTICDANAVSAVYNNQSYVGTWSSYLQSTAAKASFREEIDVNGVTVGRQYDSGIPANFRCYAEDVHDWPATVTANQLRVGFRPFNSNDGYSQNSPQTEIDADTAAQAGGSGPYFWWDTAHNRLYFPFSSTGIPVPGANQVTNQAPPAIYLTSRTGRHFWYIIPKITPGKTYTVRLHFAETNGDDQHVGARVFDVAVNNQTVLPLFDIWAASAKDGSAVVRDFTTTGNPDGTIRIELTAESEEDAQINAIEIIDPVTHTDYTAIACGQYSTNKPQAFDPKVLTIAQGNFVEDAFYSSEVGGLAHLDAVSILRDTTTPAHWCIESLQYGNNTSSLCEDSSHYPPVALNPSQKVQLQIQDWWTGINDPVWSVSPSFGTVDQSGVYTAPASTAALSSVVVTATSRSNPALSAGVTLYLANPIHFWSHH